MTSARFLAPVVLAAGAVGFTGACEHTDIACDEFEVATRTDCVDGPSGDIVIEFDKNLSCPTEDSCDIRWVRQNGHNGYWVITRSAG